MDVTVESFNQLLAQQPFSRFIQDFTKNNAKLFQARVKLLHTTYGRGAFLIHFNTLKDYQSGKIDSIKNVTFQLRSFYNVNIKKSFIINDKILWLPIALIDEYFKVPFDSSLRWYPLCSNYSVLIITYKDWTRYNRYYNNLVIDSFNIHPSRSFESRITKFFSSKKCKYKYFKQHFPIYHAQLSQANKIKKYPVDLTLFVWKCMGPYFKNEDYLNYCILHPDIGKYPYYDKFFFLSNPEISISEFQTVLMDLHRDVEPSLYLSCSFLKLLNFTKHRIDWMVAKIISVYQQFHALQRVMIGLYGSRCSHCKKVGKQYGFKMCKSCKQRYYCSRKCQKLDWNKKHGKLCHVYKTMLNPI